MLAARSDGGAVFARLIDAALADEEGKTLRREIAALRRVVPRRRRRAALERAARRIGAVADAAVRTR